jgi:hypothetical protein
MEFLGVSFSLLASCYSKHHNESWSTTHARVGYDQEFKTEEGDGDVLPEPTQQLKWAKRNKPRRNRYRSPPPYRLWKKIPSFFFLIYILDAKSISKRLGIRFYFCCFSSERNYECSFPSLFSV